jgi:hypothetical protein
VIPESVVYIGGGAFNTNKITKINGVDIDGFIYARNADGSNDSTTVVSYGGEEKVIVIPDTVKTVSDYAFYYNGHTDIDIPVSVTTIGKRAFANNRLTSVLIPNSVDTIGDYAFCYNRSLASVAIDTTNNNLSIIGKGAFTNCDSLVMIKLPTRVTKGFGGWLDSENVQYQGGDTISNFTPSYKAAIGFDIAFQVTGNSLETATVTIDGSEYITDIDGKAVVSSILVGTYSYSVSANGYKTFEGEISVVDNDVIEDILLEVSKTIEVLGNLDFGNLGVNETETDTFIIKNSGNHPVVVDTIMLPDPKGWAIDWEKEVVNVGDSLTVTVTFSPTETQNYSGTITIVGDQTNGERTINVNGIGVSRVISLAGDLNFGEVYKGSLATRILTITNKGSATLYIQDFKLPVGFDSNWISGYIDAGEDTVVTISFVPKSGRNYNDSIIINGNQTSGINKISVKGTGLITGIKTIERNSNNVTVYPNPATDYVTISSRDRIDEIHIYDVAGRLLKTEDTVKGTDVEISLSSPLKGKTLLLKIVTTNGIYLKKLVTY